MRIGALIHNDDFRNHFDHIVNEGIGRHSYVLSAEFDEVRRSDKSNALRYSHALCERMDDVLSCLTCFSCQTTKGWG